MAVTPAGGRNALVYISGTELVGGNAWTLNIASTNPTYAEFGDTWQNRVKGLLNASGSFTAYENVGVALLFNAAKAQTALATLIYPVRTDLTKYYSFSAFFGRDTGGNMGNVAEGGVPFEVAGEVTQTGYS
jgi:hypothetical protein